MKDAAYCFSFAALCRCTMAYSPPYPLCRSPLTLYISVCISLTSQHSTSNQCGLPQSNSGWTVAHISPIEHSVELTGVLQASRCVQATGEVPTLRMRRGAHRGASRRVEAHRGASRRRGFILYATSRLAAFEWHRGVELWRRAGVEASRPCVEP